MVLNFDSQRSNVNPSGVAICLHIFPKAQVTSNKNAHNFWHHFRAQFLMLFHLAWSILFGVLAWETTFSLVEILQQPIKNFHFKVFKTNTRSKMDHTKRKSMKNCAGKWCQKSCAFLFAATSALGKMWLVKHNASISYFCKIPAEGEILKREKIAQFFIASV